MDDIEKLTHLSLTELDETIQLYNTKTYKRESFLDTLYFFNKVQSEYIPTIFNSTISFYEILYKPLFEFLKNKIQNETEFVNFSIFDDRITFSDHVNTVLHIVSKSHLLINPRIEIKKTRTSVPFNIQIDTPDNPHSHIVKKYIENSKNNLVTFYKTLDGQIKFSTKVLNDLINNRTNIDKIESNEFIKIRYTRYNKWLIKKQFESFDIKIKNNMCQTAGKPGIYGSINFTLKDKSCLTMYGNGTCLIVASKRLPISEYIMVNFIYKMFFNIAFYLQILINFLTTIGIDKLYKPTCCDHNKKYCNFCIRFMKIYYRKNKIDTFNTSIDYTRKYYKYLGKLKRDYKFTTELLDEIYLLKDNNIEPTLNKVKEYISSKKGEIFNHYRIVIFGMKKIHNIDALPYLHIPESHNKLVCMFTGKKITFRSLKTSIEAMYVIAYYTKIINQLYQFNNILKVNILTIKKEELIEIYDKIWDVGN